MDLAKPCLDVGLYTDRYEEMRAFYCDRLGLPYEELLKAGRGIHQHRVGLHGSVLKLNASREPLEDARSNFVRLEIAGDAVLLSEAVFNPLLTELVVDLPPTGEAEPTGLRLVR